MVEPGLGLPNTGFFNTIAIWSGLKGLRLNQRPYIIETMHSYTLPICNAYLGCTYPC